MTPIVLLDALKEFIEKCTGDIMLTTSPATTEKGAKKGTNKGAKRKSKPEVRAAGVYKMRLPERDVNEATEKRVPYIVLQVLTGQDEHNPGKPEDSVCRVRIIVATYSEDGGEGANDVLNLVTRIRIELLRAGEVGAQFLLRKPLEWIVYPEDTNPYFFGELMSVWEMPAVRREINALFYDEVTTQIPMT